MSERLVIVEDDPIQSDLLADLLKEHGYEVAVFSEGARALAALEGDAAPADLVITDVAMPGLDGIALCKALKESRPELPVVVVTGETNLPTAVNALRAGAYDFLTKPVEKDLLIPCVKRALEKRRLVDELRRREPASDSMLFGDSEPMRLVRDLVSRVAPSGASVLVQGETGSGKELVAKALHALSPRSKAPFVAINCAALPASLVESELFGYAKGAFTDARAARQGLFVEADGGTLFLDEVAELSFDNQAKLLRTLQERTVRPLGSNSEIPFDARIMSATHKDLEAEAEAGRFRQDLFFRLNVIRVDLPPLRERGMDIVHLASRFLDSVCKRDSRQGLKLSPEVAQKLLGYPWPGNVRELENCIERLAALARTTEVSVGDLPDKVRLHQRGRFHVAADAPEEIVTLEELEKRYVQHVLTVMSGNRSRAAELLGIDRRTLYRKLDSWGLSGNGNQQNPDRSPGLTPSPPLLEAAVTTEPPLRVLVVEDDAVDRLAIRRAIARRAQVDDAHDGDSALVLLATHRYDVVLLDWFLPPDTGLAVFSRLRERQPDLPVIFLSGHGSEEVVVDAMKAGASDYVTKTAVEERDRLWRTMQSAVETHRLRREAERTRARLELAVEAAGAGAWELDLSSGQFRGDARFRELFGLDDQGPWAAEQLRARLSPESADRLEEALVHHAIAVQLQLQTSPERWVDVRGRREPFDHLGYVFGTAVDLTAVKEQEARQAALRERLMGIASHDLRNPLSAVLQASALLAHSPRLEAREKRYVQHIRASAERMTHLIVQLLDLTRVRLGGGLPLDKKRTRFDAQVRQVADELKMANPERSIGLELEEIELEADPDRLAQVASNLLGNALKHSPEDTAVSVWLRREDGSVVLEVKNRGAPIPLEMQSLIFEPFVQYGEGALRDGLGLGLYISREIVRAHGGILIVSSSAEDGTCFTAKVPFKAA